MPNQPLRDHLVPNATFGDLLRYLRRRAQLTQRDLGITVGYSEAHINRFEKNKRLPDPAAVAALFIPALDLKDEPELAQRLIELVQAKPPATPADQNDLLPAILEAIPPTPSFETTRQEILKRLRERLLTERRIVLSGLAGVGKTTLVATLAREYVAMMPVFWFTLTEGVTTFVDALIYQLAVFLVAHGQDQVKSLIQPIANRSLMPLDRRIALISAALNQQRALLCFDNAELITSNEPALQVLRHLMATTTAFMLFTSRESLPLVNVAEIKVGGLERTEGLALIACLSDEQIDAKLANRLLEKTDGNPMLVRLAVSQLVDQHAHPTLVEQLEAQPQVASYLLETVQKQSPPAEWQVLSLLAVFQTPVNLYDEDLIARMQSLKEMRGVSSAIGNLQRRHLIDDPTRAVLHPLIRDYVYRALTIDSSRRFRFHRLVADWYAEKNRDGFSAAWHYNRADLPEQALDLIEENRHAIIEHGQALSAVAILDEAHAQIKRRRTDQSDLLRRLLTTRGILLSGTLRAAESEANLRQAIALTNIPAVRADIICQLADLANQRSDFRETLRLAQTARAELAPGDLLLRARLTLLESNAFGSLGNSEEETRTANDALALTDQIVGIPQTLIGSIRAGAQLELANVARLRRDLTASMNHAQAALAAARAAHHSRMTNLSLAFVGGLFYDLGNVDESFIYRNEGLEGLLAIGDVHSAAYVLTYLADIHHLRLESNQALEKLERAAETLRAVDDMRGLASVESLRASCLLWRGRMQQACQVIEQLLKEAKGKGTERLWGYRMGKLAMVQLVQGETGAAITTLRGALDLPTTSAHHMMNFELHSTLALALSAAGEQESAAQALAVAPRLDGLSRWAEFDRALIEGYIALARGDAESARAIASQVAERAQNYPLYRQCAAQLNEATQRSVTPSTFPGWLWVGK